MSSSRDDVVLSASAFFPLRKALVCSICNKQFLNKKAFTSHFSAAHYDCIIQNCDNNGNTHQTNDAALFDVPRTVDILYNDACMAVVVKPQNIQTIGSSTSDGNAMYSFAKCRALSEALLVADAQHTTRTKTKGNCNGGGNEIRPVHRLDKPTGGLLVIGKTKPTISTLCEMFRERKVQKRYRAIVAGDMLASFRNMAAAAANNNNDGNNGNPSNYNTTAANHHHVSNDNKGGNINVLEGTINSPIRGAPSITKFKIVSVTPSGRFGSITTVDLYPVTGRK
eukprot:CAMPEP_0194399824 /NCGR_PEP_ID=MMETSP0174-20130528/126871_1 /TAXON_ID=216777 /ORGANISM="Proboscia alata, Strain PI-D3" /LENGTH=280 /DNA_ID=CAMNT_0039196269 /DNA_START=534 /DNA_END=1373 /DNA_ORIENTATION=-